jgi:hypothetical protein
MTAFDNPSVAEAPTSSAQGMTRIRVTRDSSVRVTFDPYSSVLALACAGARDFTRGAITPLSPLALQMSERGLRAVARIVTPGASLSPDCIGPADLRHDTTVDEEIDRLRSLTDAELHADFACTFGAEVPAHWRAVVDRPRSWCADLADALATLWGTVEPVWRRESNLRSQEAERVGAAAARSLMDVVLAGVHRRGRAEDGVLSFPDPDATTTDTVGRTVVLAPILQRLDVTICSLERADAVWFAYPVPGSAADPADPAGLDALLTAPRAQLLRMLTTAHTMSQVAAALNLSPSAATYHIDALLTAGLVTRQRDGRRILVERTPRGATLVELYDR